MMIIYNLTINLYYFAILISSLFNSKAKKWIKGRRRLFQKINIPGDEKIIWVHCASLGEFEQGRPLIEAIKDKHSEYKIVLTFFSPSGYEIRNNYPLADYVYYLPLDTPPNARNFIQKIHPEIIIFVKYEFWYHYIHTANRQNIPIYLISGIFRESQWFFKWYGQFYKKMLLYFKHIFVQNEHSKSLLHRYHINHVSVAGDTRYDRVLKISRSVKHIPEAEQFKQGALTLIAGSTWPKDEALLIHFLNEMDPEIKCIIAPHEINKSHINEMVQRIHKKTVLFSTLSVSSAMEADVLIIDNIGMLSSLYQYGEIAYIGGGFGKGIHNILEAATFGMPVVFGPNHQKFDEALGLIHQKAAFPVASQNEYNEVMNTLVHSVEVRQKSGETAQRYVKQNAGATSVILSHIGLM
jgi:3-deoxy-D-manno-octulosonic-acid transferase